MKAVQKCWPVQVVWIRLSPWTKEHRYHIIRSLGRWVRTGGSQKPGVFFTDSFSVENATSILPKLEENRVKQSHENEVGPYPITNVSESCIPKFEGCF